MVALLFLGLVLASQQGSGLDPCEQKLPSSLRAEFAKRFVGYRQIRVSDYEPATVESEKQYHGGSPCIAAEGGDFDGNHEQDFVFLAVKPSERLIAVVALRKGKTWRMEELWDLGIDPNSDHLGCCYANVLPPGRYENVYGTTPDPTEPPERNERLEYTSTRQAPVVGGIESSGIAFFLSGGRWLHVWIQD